MADNKKLVVEIDADTGKFAAKLQELPNLIAKQADAAKAIKTLDEARLGILQKNKDLISDIQAKISATAAKVKDLNDAFKLGAVNATLNSVNKQFADVSKSLEKIAIQKKELEATRQAQNFASTLGTVSNNEAYNKRSGPYNTPLQQGTVAEKRQAEDDASFRLQEGLRKAHEQRDFELVESYAKKIELAKQVSNAKIAADMETAFKKQQSITTNFGNTITNSGVFKPKSDYGIALTQGLNQSAKIQDSTKELNSQKTAIDAVTQAHRSLAESVVLSTLYYKTFTFTLQKVKEGLTAIPRIGIQLEATIASLSSTVGTSAGAASAIKAINQEAERTGLTISALRDSFKTFQASTALAGESLDSTWRMFTNVNTVATALHLTTDQTNHVFLALAQIFNKTKVQSEELVKQLGNLLPGAFASFAAANKDLFKNSADLISKMKQGVVTAHDTIEKFTNFMANRFKEAFAVASIGLNSEIGRMQNAFTLLGETIYKANRGPIIDFVKGITSLTTALNDDINGANRFYEALKQITLLSFSVFAGAAINKLFLMKEAIIGTTIATRALEASFAFLKSPQFIITGLVLIGAELYNLAKGSEAAKEKVLDFYTSLGQAKKDAEAKKLGISVEDDPGVLNFRKNIALVQQDITKYEAILAKAEKRKKVTLFNTELPQEKEARTQLALAKAHEIDLTEQLEKQKETVLAQIRDKAAVENIEALDIYEKKRRELTIDREQALGNDIIAARMQTEDRYKSMLEDAQKKRDQISKVPTLLRSEDSQTALTQATKDIEDIQLVIEKAGTSIKKQAKDNIKAIEDELGVNKETQAKLLDENENNLKLNIVSYETFFKRKLDLYENDYQARKFLLSKELEETKDPVKSSDISGKLRELDLEQERRISALKVANVEAVKQRTVELSNLQQEYYKLTGDEETNLKTQQSERYGQIKTYLQEQVELGNENARNLLTQLGYIEDIAIVEAKVAKSRVANQAKENQYQQALERINILKNTGALSELQANRAIDEENKKEIQTKQEAIDLEEQVLAVMDKVKNSNAYNQKAEEIRKMKGELENFKLTADTTAQFIETTLGKSFDNAFASFIDGSQTAQQAFKSFSKSIVNELAKIAAQEVRTGITGALKTGISAIGAAFAAEGKIVSGVSSGNGQILTSPTWFPTARPTMMANGGVVAGEAGAEGFFPVKRLKNGKLGVYAEKSSQASGNVISINVNVERSKTMSDDQYAVVIAEQIARKVAKEEITANNRNKSYISNATKYG